MRLKESEMIAELTRQGDLFLPLVIKSIKRESSGVSNFCFDAVIEFTIQEGPSFTAAAEVLTISTPKTITEKSRFLKNVVLECKTQKLLPMIIAPYISDKQSMRLQEEGISWIDLSGNMRVTGSKSSSQLYMGM